MTQFGVFRAPISEITNVSPQHPAASFYYPDLSKLPTIAKYSFNKIKEFSTNSLSIDHCKNDIFNNNKNNTEKKVIHDTNEKKDDFVTITTFDVTINHPLNEDNTEIIEKDKIKTNDTKSGHWKK